MKPYEPSPYKESRIFTDSSGIEYRYNRAETIYAADAETSNDPKRIYKIKFIEKAPGGMLTDKYYVLKQGKNLTASRLTATYPRDRTLWDFVDHEGRHLRKILAKNKDANELQIKIKNDGVKNLDMDFSYSCEIIEPYYNSLTHKSGKLHSKILRLGDVEKINCLIQIAEGLKELYSDQNKIKYDSDTECKISAHRDLKFSNVVYTEEDGEKNYLLIDFPSVKCLPIKEARVTSSINNTAPELLLEDFDINEECDVFALAMMMAEIFEVYRKDDYSFNPLALFFKLNFVEKYGKEGAKNASYDPSSYKDVYTEIYKELSEKNKLNSYTWLDEYLKKKSIAVNWPKQLKELFYKAICFDPSCRMTLDEFMTGLTDAADYLTYNSTNISYGIFAFDTTKLNENTKKVYLREAKKIFSDITNGGAKYLVVDFDEININENAIMSLDKFSLDSDLLCSTIEDVENVLNSFSATVQNRYSILSERLLRAKRLLRGNTDTDVRFNGHVYVFTPIAPVETNLAPYFNENGMQYSINDIKNGLIIDVYHGGTAENDSWFFSHPVADIDREQNNGVFYYDEKTGRFYPV